MGIKGENTLMNRPRLCKEMSFDHVLRLSIDGTSGPCKGQRAQPS
jgi:hypothetical protein